MFLNVRDFGAHGDGLHDDSQAIQYAFNRAIELEGDVTVYFPAGEYLVSRTTKPGKAWCLYVGGNTIIKGEALESTKLKLTNGNGGFTRILYIQQVENVVIQNLTFDGNCANQRMEEEHMGGIWMNSAKNVVVENCHFMNTCGDGIGIRGPKDSSRDIIVRNCSFANNGRNGITLGSGFVNVLIEGCEFSPDISASPIDSEPEKGYCANVEIKNNVFNGDQLEVMTLGGHVWVEGYDVSGNTFNNTGLYMVRARGVNVHNNRFTFLDTTKHAVIRVRGSNEDITIAENSFHYHSSRPLFDIAATQSAGIPINVEISNNNISTKRDLEIVLNVRGADKVRVTNNVFSHFEKCSGTVILCRTTRAISSFEVHDNTFLNYKVGVRFIPIKDRGVDHFSIKGNLLRHDISNATARSTMNMQDVEYLILDMRIRVNSLLIKRLELEGNELEGVTGAVLKYRQ